MKGTNNKQSNIKPSYEHSSFKMSEICKAHKREAYGEGENHPTHRVLSILWFWHRLSGMLLIFVPVKVLWKNNCSSKRQFKLR